MVNESKKKEGVFGCLACLIKKCFVVFVPGFIAALILFVIINAALVPTSKPEFCGELCHEMDEPYASWKKSPHHTNRTGIEVGCVECHLPPKDKYFTHLAAKVYTGTKDAYHHFAGTEYKPEEIRKEVREHMTNDVCMRCHTKIRNNPKNPDIAELHEMTVFDVPEGEKPAKCIECHKDAGHARE